ncbi:hypothetical protein [Leisingera daeponensis]|uniref:hypothetical protein n=1 Tax=Leisingera daeponensis TaxID=405746 RepID=UPI001C94AA22|nr:hypothetical protein [Leisingera daeponensis]MBY6058631.1 hypothetical protein [Leisingera daeponensis]
MPGHDDAQLAAVGRNGRCRGIIAPILLGGSHSTYVAITVREHAIAVLIGIAAALAGTAIRHKGATV